MVSGVAQRLLTTDAPTETTEDLAASADHIIAGLSHIHPEVDHAVLHMCIFTANPYNFMLQATIDPSASPQRSGTFVELIEQLPAVQSLTTQTEQSAPDHKNLTHDKQHLGEFAAQGWGQQRGCWAGRGKTASHLVWEPPWSGQAHSKGQVAGRP